MGCVRSHTNENCEKLVVFEIMQTMKDIPPKKHASCISMSPIVLQFHPPKTQTSSCPMTRTRTYQSRNREMSDRLRKRAESRRRILGSIGYLALGILLFYAWQWFKTFAGPAGAMGPLPHDHPMHRVVVSAVFLAVAIVPVAVYFILRLRARWGKARETR